ncbi:MAG: ATP-dependent Clp protease adaptor ClpS [bacterium]
MNKCLTETNPKILTLTKTVLMSQTVLYNCNCHTFDAVIEQIMRAIGCNSAKASQLANVADQFDSVTVFKGTRENCDQVADVLGSIGLLVKVV